MANWQPGPVDPGQEGLEAHAEQARLEHRRARNPLKKKRRRGDPGRNPNIIQRFLRRLQGK